MYCVYESSILYFYFLSPTSCFFYCIVYSFNIITVYYNSLPFGCCEVEIPLFTGQIKGILILNLI